MINFHRAKKVWAMTDIRNSNVSGQVITLDAESGDFHDLYESTFLDCEIIVQCPARKFRFVDCHMTGGVFRQKSLLKNSRFERVIFHGVKFTGRFSGVDFGWRNANQLRSENMVAGEVLNCDFSEARMDGCRFFNADIQSNRLPGRPFAAVRAGSPLKAPSETIANDLEWRLLIGRYESIPCEDVVVVDNIELLSKEYKIPLQDLVAFFDQHELSEAKGRKT